MVSKPQENDFNIRENNGKTKKQKTDENNIKTAKYNFKLDVKI